MSGFWAARGEGHQKRTVFYAKADDTLVRSRGSDIPSLEPQWHCKKKRKTCNGGYKWFAALIGVELQPGEGPVFIETRRAKG